jgi:RNA polymerase-interacting CarD/CdnL/TRCF family regulator
MVAFFSQERRFGMDYQIGDTAIHWTYGLGEIVDIEEKPINNQPTTCYVFRTTDLTVWVPVDESDQHSLRVPTHPEDFEALYAILTSPGEQLHEDRLLRKNQLMTRMRDGQLASICRVVRDLWSFKRSTKLNDQERSILERAEKSLLTEWTYSLNVPFNKAQQAMIHLLGE